MKGTYAVPEDASTIRVKITDLLSESWEGSVTMAKRTATTSRARLRLLPLPCSSTSRTGADPATLQATDAQVLDFNNPEKNPKAFLRQPQFEALEIYVFLKEFPATPRSSSLPRVGQEEGPIRRLRGRGLTGNARQGTCSISSTKEQYKAVFAATRKNSRVYPNYIFALTMGLAKPF